MNCISGCLGQKEFSTSWQVKQQSFNGLIPEKQRMQLDNEYARHFAGDNYTFFYDMKLIIRTIRGWFSGLP